ncbi:uncharacterized protein LOC143037493 isoform X9 [Oratosquilla oratoria]|uniref:uncharacterized protein LOC143037493 isoform X9 n=1 Tax=Oratosquilla oratoria TaxID=337810 RepID=UPI003F775869
MQIRSSTTCLLPQAHCPCESPRARTTCWVCDRQITDECSKLLCRVVYGMANPNGEEGQNGSRRLSSSRQTPTKNSAGSSPRTTTPRNTPGRKPLPVFNSYMSLFQVQEKLKKGEVIEGVLRINPKNYEDAYISAPDGGMDIYIGGVRDRNAALHGDVVALQLKPVDQWKVLYDVLDKYLEENEDEMKIVYSPLLESNDSASNANVTALSYNQPSDVHKTTPTQQLPDRKKGYVNKQQKSSVCNWVNKADTILELKVEDVNDTLCQADSDVIVEEEKEVEEGGDRQATGSRRRKTRRRKRRKNGSESSSAVVPSSNTEHEDSEHKDSKNTSERKQKYEGKSEDDLNQASKDTHQKSIVVKSESGNDDVEEIIRNEEHEEGFVAILDFGPTNVCDELVLLNQPHDEDATFASVVLPPLSSEERKHSDFDYDGSDEELGPGMAVAPDELSECDSMDDESGQSEILDYEQLCEDQEFMRSQQEAFFKEQQARYEEQSEKSKDGKAAGKENCAQDAWGKSQCTPKIVELDETNQDTKVDVKSEIEEASGSQNREVPQFDKHQTGMEQEISFCTSQELQVDTWEDKNDSGIANLSIEFQQSAKKEDAVECTQVNKSRKPRKIDMDKLADDINRKFEELEIESVKQERDMCAQKKTASEKKQRLSVSERIAASVQKKLQEHGEEDPVEDAKTSRRNRRSRTKKKKGKPEQIQGQETEVSCKQQTPVGSFAEKPAEPVSATRTTPGNLRHLDSDSKRTEPNVLQVRRLSCWEKFIQRTGNVVYILERKHTRLGAGQLKLFADKNPNFALFSPTDYRLPRMKIPMIQCPKELMLRPDELKNRIFMARIVQWREPKFAMGELVRDVGAVGDIEAETEAMLLEHGIDYGEFPPSISDGLPTQLPWTIPDQEIKQRADFRNECIFSIDPATARDLDDAVSCTPLPNGNFRVGVHIADVSFFVRECTPLDRIAADRATSVYLTQKVIPMLPRVLCEELCSLNPGEDRLAFSVAWELSPKGKVLSEWFGRSVIRSCVKLAYEHAQVMIDEPEKCWSLEELPQLTGGYTPRQISKIVNDLNGIAKNLRQKRFRDGALRLDQVKLCFSLDGETKMPNGFYVYEQRDSNRLIEEFMLLANMAVAHKIYSTFPEITLLRRHPPPLPGPMDSVVNLLASFGVKLDASTSGHLHASIQQYVGQDKFSMFRMLIIVNMCSRPMQFARYFCTGVLKDERQFAHYALNVPLYTHFTSPIRRYADVIVHRLLAAAVDTSHSPVPQASQHKVQQFAEHCNDKKQTSKTVQELSSELYLAQFIRQVGEMCEEAMVMGVLDRSFDVLVLRLGVVKRVYTDKIGPNATINAGNIKGGANTIMINWKPDEQYPAVIQKISIFSVVKVSLKACEGQALKFNATLIRPQE